MVNTAFFRVHSLKRISKTHPRGAYTLLNNESINQ